MTGPPAADLPERLTTTPNLRFGIEEIDGNLGIGVEPVELEAAVAHVAVVATVQDSSGHEPSDRG